MSVQHEQPGHPLLVLKGLWLPLGPGLPETVSAEPSPNNTFDVAGVDRERILSAADAALNLEPSPITKFPAKLSEGGPNDFYSNGDYWWPNPDTTNGLPYVQRDGQTNPDNFVEHRRCIAR